jgi:hypothetical protein
MQSWTEPKYFIAPSSVKLLAQEIACRRTWWQAKSALRSFNFIFTLLRADESYHRAAQTAPPVFLPTPYARRVPLSKGGNFDLM